MIGTWGLYQSTKESIVSLRHGSQSQLSAHRDQTQKILQVLEHVVGVEKFTGKRRITTTEGCSLRLHTLWRITAQIMETFHFFLDKYGLHLKDLLTECQENSKKMHLSQATGRFYLDWGVFCVNCYNQGHCIPKAILFYLASND